MRSNYSNLISKGNQTISMFLCTYSGATTKRGIGNMGYFVVKVRGFSVDILSLYGNEENDKFSLLEIILP